ncbi:MAG: hypothetical protein CMJ77_12095 [Planctomycetaceae bacterium]|nr:hypothetical protein [Planctomycetaceae bacterium]
MRKYRVVSRWCRNHYKPVIRDTRYRLILKESKTLIPKDHEPICIVFIEIRDPYFAFLGVGNVRPWASEMSDNT